MNSEGYFSSPFLGTTECAIARQECLGSMLRYATHLHLDIPAWLWPSPFDPKKKAEKCVGGAGLRMLRDNGLGELRERPRSGRAVALASILVGSMALSFVLKWWLRANG